jgi:hypothetical protein
METLRVSLFLKEIRKVSQTLMVFVILRASLTLKEFVKM